MSERPRKYGNLRDSVNSEGLTEVRTYGNTEVRKDVPAQANAEVLQEARTDAHTGTREDLPPDLLTTVREGLQTRKQYPGGVKLTLEITPALNTRAKRYLLDVPGGTVRALLTELLQAFLDAEEGKV